ncbi:hypothetical protein [Nitrosomonas marina]|uniref:Uncharacterized protein n=1 Tax=Nitrosomonas marina TaxID=917 RepID=A0A1H8CN13_9PROT|nr:hypothetical protein [Nitrosomonas marina]SEM95814.1 hypothetical protein SAMN05216325_10522 [Nitrosomonas marina]
MIIRQSGMFLQAFVLSLPAVMTVHAETCKTIQFQQGTNSTTIAGIAPPDSVICYTITTAIGQTVDLAVSGSNMVFSVEGLIDAQQKFQFTAEQKSYRINVGQLMRAVAEKPYTLAIFIE